MFTVKILDALFGKIDKMTQEFMWTQGPRGQNNLEKKNKVERLTLPDFKTYYKAILARTVVSAQG